MLAASVMLQLGTVITVLQMQLNDKLAIVSLPEEIAYTIWTF